MVPMQQIATMNADRKNKFSFVDSSDNETLKKYWNSLNYLRPFP